MVEEGSPLKKHSPQTKEEMAVFKIEKATAKEAHEAKKLAKQVVATKLGSAKKLPKTLKGEREETLGPLNNPKSGEGRT
jgi:hypothetical protein